MNTCIKNTDLSFHSLRSWDQSRLNYHARLPDGPADRAVVYIHRGHEHGARWEETMRCLDFPGCAHFAWDARGHGRSEGRRGHAPGVAALVRDLDHFVRHLSEEYDIPIENLVVVGHSVGAVVVATWVHDFAPPIRGMVLAAPAFRVKLYVPFAIPFLRAKGRLFGAGEVRSYVKAGLLTHDPAAAEAYRADPMIFSQISERLLLDLHDTANRLVEDAGAIVAPTLVMTAGSDWIVRNSAAEKFYSGLSSAGKKYRCFEGFYHSLFQEKDRAAVTEETRTFIAELFERRAQHPSLLDAHRDGYTKDEYERLRQPGPAFYGLARSVIRFGARLSEGLRLGRESGFDSGVTLDYVYRNRAAGKTPLGRWMDRMYLNSIGWRGIRVRRRHLEERLNAIIRDRLAITGEADLLDIAAGGGRYILETLHGLNGRNVSAHLQDYKEVNLAAARKLCNELQLRGVTIARGDAFDLGEGLSPDRTFDIIVVSGLYELFPDNESVRGSLAQVSRRLRPGGFLLYTNQPWHPQLAFIARVLRNREGDPWIMRRRTQAEMDQLVTAAGLIKKTMDIDEYGIFTVSVAQKPS